MKRKRCVVMSVILLMLFAGTGAAAYKMQKNKKSVSDRAEEKTSEISTRKNSDTESGDTGQAEEQTESQTVDKAGKTENDTGDNIIILGAVKMELLSKEYVECDDLSSNTKYPLEYFVRDNLPSSEVTSEEVDWESIYAEAPEVKETRHVENFADYDLDAYLAAKEKYKDVIEKYTYTKTMKGRMCFIKCRLTNTRDSKAIGYMPYDVVYWVPDTEDLDYTESVWYFDKPIYTEGDERESKYFCYEIDGGESMECTMGIYVVDQRLGENEQHYYGVIPEGNDDPTFDPTEVSNLVNLDNIPNEEN